MTRRLPTNLPLWTEFAVLTVVFMSVSLAIGLSVRGLAGQSESAVGEPVSLMQLDVAAADKMIEKTDPVVARFPAPPKPQVDAEIKAEQTQIQIADESVVMFDGRPIRPARTVTMRVTAYSPDARSCGKWADGLTASGYSVWTNGMKLVAADTSILPFGTILTVPGYNDAKPVQVLDRGGAIKGHRLDVLYPTHEIARRWGSQNLTVTVWEYAD